MFKGIQRAVISGGASGLGLAVAESVVNRNGFVTLLDLDQVQGRMAAERLGDRVQFLVCDIRDHEKVASCLDQAVQFNGGLNLAINCAGILGTGRVIGKQGLMDPLYFRNVMEINLTGAFLFTEYSASCMQRGEMDARNERGLIIHTASIAAYEGQVGQVAYAASKGGVVGMILPLAREFAPLGIRVVGIAPGVFATPMMESIKDDIKARLEADIPFPSRMGSADEFAALVQNIHDNQMINGTVIRIDGASRLR